MKKLLTVIALLLVIPTNVNADCWDELEEYNEPIPIEYGYNAVGDYAPMRYGDQQVEYGYNAMGDYVPMSVGGRQIQYGFNAVGDYVPISY